MDVSYYLQAPIDEVRQRLESAGISGHLVDNMPWTLNANVAIDTMTEWHSRSQLQEILKPWKLLDEDDLEWPPEYLRPLGNLTASEANWTVEPMVSA